MRDSGYTIDIAYPALFHRETGPYWITAAAAAIGQHIPALDRPFRYLDLGCGSGLSVALLAAANPNGTFMGVDLNPAHIAQAGTWAALLPNLHFIRSDFAALAREDAPGTFEAPFDIIVAHGVYSWIADDRRADFRRIVQRHLAPGGFLYVHYTCHPGQSPFAGAQAMMRRIADLTPGDAKAKVDNALTWMRALQAGGGGYMVAHPAVGHMLFNRDQGAACLAHDLLARHWSALHVGDVMEDMETIGCDFLGSAALLDNVDALSLPGAAVATLSCIGDIKARETARDLARNQSMRRDLYRRGLSGLSPGAYHDQLSAIRYHALPGIGHSGDLTIAMPIGPVSVDAALADPVRARLRRGSASIGELQACLPSNVPASMLVRLMLMLVTAGEAHPTTAASGNPVPVAFNRVAASQGWLAAPVIGSAISLDATGAAIADLLLHQPGSSRFALVATLRERLPSIEADMAVDHHERHVIPIWQSLRALPG